MTNQLKEGAEFVQHNWRVLVIIGVLGISAYLIRQLNQSDAESTLNQEDAPLVGDFSAIDTPTSPSNTSLPAATAASSANGGETYPYTHIFYHYASPPAGYEGMTCFTIPSGGTAYGTQLLGGPDNSTLSDISEGVVFKGGIPYIVPLGIPLAQWDQVELVHAGDIGCSR